MGNWVYYEVRDHRGRLRYTTLSKADAGFFARKLIQRGEVAPDIFEVPRY